MLKTIDDVMGLPEVQTLVPSEKVILETLFTQRFNLPTSQDYVLEWVYRIKNGLIDTHADPHTKAVLNDCCGF